MGKSLQFVADTIDGEIQPTPGLFNFPCGKVTPIGVNVVKSYDENLSIVAKRVFEVNYNNHSFGSSQFKSLSDFNQYVGVVCQCCPFHCAILMNGCVVLLNGCNFVLSQKKINPCAILINGCNLTINGCDINYTLN